MELWIAAWLCCLLIVATPTNTIRIVSQAPTITLMSISEVYPPKLKTEEKRTWLTPLRVDLYNKGIAQGGVLVPTGPFQLLDIHHLTQSVALCLPQIQHQKS